MKKRVLVFICLFFCQVVCAADDIDMKEVQFKNLKEEAVSLRDTKRPVVLVFWATWCESCQKEFLVLNQLQKEFKDKVNVFAVSLDNDSETRDRFLKENPAGFQVLTSTLAPKILRQFCGSETIPAMVIFDKDLDFVASLRGTKPLHQIQGILRPLILN